MTDMECFDFVKDIRNSKGIIYSLENFSKFLEKLDNPQNQLKFVHVAGTNGKGSICEYIASVLAVSGYKVGKYTSPALYSDTEIIQIYKVDIDKLQKNEIPINKYASCVRRIYPIYEGFRDCISSFEIETAIAFMYFLEENVDIVVLECGMGGEYDATNVIQSSLCSVFSHISMDHMYYLGNDICSIAKAKAGIIKSDSDVVISKQSYPDVERIIKSVAEEKGSNFFCVKNKDADIAKGHGIPGVYQIQNAMTALLCLDILKKKGYGRISTERKKRGVSEATLRGRMEIINTSPLTIIDGGHNEDAIRALSISLRYYYPDEKFTFITGCFKDKQYDTMYESILDIADRILTITPPSKRGLSAENLAGSLMESVDKASLNIDIRSFETPKEACDEAFSYGNKIVIFGTMSFYKEFVDLLRGYSTVFKERIYEK